MSSTALIPFSTVLIFLHHPHLFSSHLSLAASVSPTPPTSIDPSYWIRSFIAAIQINTTNTMPSPVATFVGGGDPTRDHTLNIPNECLALFFHSLSSGNCKNYSLVCRWWLAVKGHGHDCLTLDARAALLDAAPALFAHFDAVTALWSDSISMTSYLSYPHRLSLPPKLPFVSPLSTSHAAPSSLHSRPSPFPATASSGPSSLPSPLSGASHHSTSPTTISLAPLPPGLAPWTLSP